MKLCSETDPQPEGMPEKGNAKSFIQAPENGGKHFLQLQMGALRIKGHQGGHMSKNRFTQLPAHQKSFWEDPSCPCGTGHDSPEHRILRCPNTREQRQLIAEVITKLSDETVSPDHLVKLWQSSDQEWPVWWGIAGWWPKKAQWKPKNQKTIWQKWTHWVGKTLMDCEKWLWQKSGPRHVEDSPQNNRVPLQHIPQPQEPRQRRGRRRPRENNRPR